LNRKRRWGEAALTTGLVLAAAFALAWYLTRSDPNAWLWLFPIVFAGILPAIAGIRRLRRREGEGDRPGLAPAEAQRKVLLAAREARGLVTPALVALKTELSLEQAQGLLEQMARKGYAAMHVRENGRIEFEFPEFR
jgi:peptidoglycan/LPS O-acetylase OafA/YrhL